MTKAALDAALACVAELEKAIGELFILDVGRSTQGRAWVKIDQEGFDRLRAARDAVRTVPSAPQGGSVGNSRDCGDDPNDLERWHCPACKRDVAGIFNRCCYCGGGRYA